MSDTKPPLAAKFWYAWAQSCTYWGNRTMSKQLYRWAVSSYTRAALAAPVERYAA